jgi:predicted ATPase
MIPRIREVFIENYKSIEKARVTLKPFTVLVGANGSGKSNFVDALEFVGDALVTTPATAVRKRSGYRHVVSQLDVEPGHRILFGSPPISAAIRFRLLLSLTEQMEASYGFEISRDSPNSANVVVRHEACLVRWHDGRSANYEIRDGRFIVPFQGIRPKLAPDRLALGVISGAEEFHPVFDFLTSMRFYRIRPETLREPRLGSEPNDYLRTDGRNAVAVFRRIYEEDAQHPGRYGRLARLIAKISSSTLSVNFSVMASSRENASVEDADAIQTIEFMQEAGPQSAQNLDASYVSDGTLSALACLLATYQSGFQPVVAIEEPEATIHPAAAEVLYQAFLDASHDRQIIIVTHSPDILNQKDLSSENIRVVVMEHGRTFIAPVSEGAREAIRKKLYMPGELLQMNELDADITAAKKLADSSSDA